MLPKIKDRKYEITAIALFVLFSIPIMILAVKRPGWIQATIPYKGFLSIYSVLGYTQILDNELAFFETVPFYHAVWNFNGADFQSSFYHMRAVYPYLASILSPFLGLRFSFVILNYLGWALAAFTAWHFTKDLFNDKRAALISVLLVLGGIGWITVLGAFDSHLYSSLIYYLGVWVIFKSGVWKERKALKTHIALGLFFAISCLVYNTGYLLLLGYIFVSFRKNNIKYIFGAILIGISSSFLWRQFLSPFGSAEKGALIQSLHYWVDVLNNPPIEIIKIVIQKTFTFISLESPLVFLSGIAGLIWLVRTKEKERFFILVFLLLPLISLMPYKFIHDVAITNYIIYGVSIFLFSALGGGISRWMDSSNKKRIVPYVVTCVILASHFVWSLSSFAGYLGPTFAYYYSYSKTGNLFTVKPEFSEMTGNYPEPEIVGGGATLSDAGMTDTAPLDMAFSIKRSLKMHVLLSALFLLMLLISVPLKRFLVVGGLLIFIVVSSIFYGRFFTGFSSTFWDTFYSAMVPADNPIQYTVELSDGTIQGLEKYLLPENSAFLYFGLTTDDASVTLEDLNIKLMIGDEEILLDHYYILNNVPPGCVMVRVSPEQLNTAMNDSSTLSWSISSEYQYRMRGWQSSELLQRNFAPNIGFLPSFEIRVYDPSGTLLYLAY